MARYHIGRGGESEPGLILVLDSEAGLAYKIVSTGQLAKVEWLGEVDTTADEAVNQESKPRKVVAWMVVVRSSEMALPHVQELVRLANIGAVKESHFPPSRPHCTSPSFGHGTYECREVDCPVHGDRNRAMA